MFSDSFRKQLSPLQSDDIRKQLQEAILAADSARFRQILENVSSKLASEERLYSVITLEDDTLKPIMVDHTGHRIDQGYIIKAGMPIEQLNADIVGNEMVITIGDEQFRAFIGPMADQDNTDASDTRI